jgi:hypothetical protein
VRYDRAQERATITREQAQAGADGRVRIVDQPELRYSRVRNDVVSRLAVALYTDLELHVEVPYVLGDDASWRYASQNGFSVGPGGLNRSGIATNQFRPDGTACFPDPADPTNRTPLPGQFCPLFPVGSPDSTVFHGGKVGDVKAGLAWAIFNDRRDDTKPTWLIGVDATLPTAQLYDPAKDRDPTAWVSPYFVDSKRGPVGEKIWKWDFYTALSKRLGAFDPYFKAHVTAMTPSAATFSNCDHATELSSSLPSTGPAQATTVQAANCSASRWTDEAKAKLPFVAGVTFGTELVPFEDPKEDQKVSFDVRLYADYTSHQRFYNELTDASGRIHTTEGYATLGGLVALYLRASKYVSLNASASIATKTAHFLTGEYLGKSRSDPASNPDDVNPNFDVRYDAVGNRFRITEVSVFTLSAAAKIEF